MGRGQGVPPDVQVRLLELDVATLLRVNKSLQERIERLERKLSATSDAEIRAHRETNEKLTERVLYLESLLGL